MEDSFVQHIDTPIGTFCAKASHDGLQSLHLVKTVTEDRPSQLTALVASQLVSYFNGKLKRFDVPLDFGNASEFYIKVWQQLLQIPFGATISYLDIAKALDNPKAVRAVGMANGRNNIPIIVPCHRVIGSNGNLTGFALGLDVKRYLLSFENPKSYALQTSLF